jgi:uncharacterized membrane protein YgcG
LLLVVILHLGIFFRRKRRTFAFGEKKVRYSTVAVCLLKKKKQTNKQTNAARAIVITMSGKIAKPCRLFAHGKCKFGARCDYLHEPNQKADSSKQVKAAVSRKHPSVGVRVPSVASSRNKIVDRRSKSKVSSKLNAAGNSRKRARNEKLMCDDVLHIVAWFPGRQNVLVICQADKSVREFIDDAEARFKSIFNRSVEVMAARRGSDRALLDPEYRIVDVMGPHDERVLYLETVDSQCEAFVPDVAQPRVKRVRRIGSGSGSDSGSDSGSGGGGGGGSDSGSANEATNTPSKASSKAPSKASPRAPSKTSKASPKAPSKSASPKTSDAPSEGKQDEAVPIDDDDSSDDDSSDDGADLLKAFNAFAKKKPSTTTSKTDSLLNKIPGDKLATSFPVVPRRDFRRKKSK